MDNEYASTDFHKHFINYVSYKHIIYIVIFVFFGYNVVLNKLHENMSQQVVLGE